MTSKETGTLSVGDYHRDFAPADSRGRFETAEVRRRQRIAYAESEALARVPTAIPKSPERLKVEPRLTTLCHLIVCCLPRLNGTELEYVWSKMEELIERRRSEELRRKRR
jgi:hypothetical protein